MLFTFKFNAVIAIITAAVPRMMMVFRYSARIRGKYMLAWQQQAQLYE